MVQGICRYPQIYSICDFEFELLNCVFCFAISIFFYMFLEHLIK